MTTRDKKSTLGSVHFLSLFFILMGLLYQRAEKFINESFWKLSHDKNSSTDIQSLVAAKMLRDDKEKDVDYYGHRPGVFHVSDLTGCLRGALHAQMGAKPDKEADARTLGIFKAGNLFEDFIVDALGDKVIQRQREYTLKYKDIVLVGRSDYTLDDNGVIRVCENKSVNSQSFWYRKQEGTLVAWNNQIQLQTYLWLERMLFQHEWHGMFSYISKDDCTISSCAVKYNPEIIEQIVIPSLDALNNAFVHKDPALCPVPQLTEYSESRQKWKVNWLCSYCNYHNSCAGDAWLVEANAEVTRKNRDAASTMSNPFASKQKPVISIA